MNRRGAREMSMSYIVALAIGIIVVIVVLFAGFGILDLPDFFPDFIQSDEKIGLDIYDGNSEIPYFKFDDGVWGTPYLYFAFKEGWMWSDGTKWFGVGEVNADNFKKLNEKDRDFILGLKGESCEIGLREIIKRVLKNEEGGWFSGASVYIIQNNKEKKFEYESGEQVYDLCEVIKNEQR